ncbi:MAG: metal ABC transporter substrate-binding protein [Anaerolineales bacterium]
MTKSLRFLLTLLALAGVLIAGAGCGEQAASPATEHEETLPTLTPVSLAGGETLQVVATTSIVADVVAEVGGEAISLTQLMPLGADPHGFEPTPQDAAAVSDAHVVFVNGVGLETFMDDLLQSADEGAVVPVSAGIELLPFRTEEAHAEDEGQAHDEHEHEDTVDPHVWFDPHNVRVWVDNIQEALSTLDPANAELYASHADAYRAELEALDGWIREEVAQVPEGNRVLVTDHASLTYFADEYGFRQVGAVVPATSTLAEPSAQELAALQQAIAQYDVPAIFVGRTVNPTLAAQVAQDTGVELLFLYTGSLSEEGEPAGSYLDFMRYDVSTIVDGLR